MRAGTTLVSAHRCNDLELVRRALGCGADLVEFDVDRTPGGVTYVGHGDPAAAATAPSIEEILALLAPSGVLVHLDLKFGPAAGAGAFAAHHDVVERVAGAVGAARVVVTTRDEAVVHGVRAWADRHHPEVRVALSLGGSHAGRPLREQVRLRWSELRPARRVAACRADLVTAQWAVAALGAGRWARRTGTPLMVWTVDADPLLRHWLRPGRAWVVTTNRPDRALALRIRPDAGAAPAADLSD